MVAEHITNLPCAKHSGKRAHTQMLVVHSMETPLANGYALSLTQNWLGKMYQANGALIEASANVNVGPDTLIRSVHTDYAAWHASWANSMSVGYEQTGYAAYSREQWLSGPGRDQIDRLAREMALDAAAYGIPLRWLTAAEVNAIRNGDRTIKGLVTHAVIDPGNRTDPGSQYPYDVLLASIKAYSGNTSPQSGNIEYIQEDELSNADVERIINEVNEANEAKHKATREAIAAVAGKVVAAQFDQTGTDGKVNGRTSIANVLGVHDANVVLTRGVIISTAEVVAKTVAAIQTDSDISPEEQGKRAAAAFLAEVEGLNLNITAGDK